MALEQPLRLVLVAGDLQDVGEFGLVLSRLQVPADAAEAVPQDQQAEHDAEVGGTRDQAGGPGRVRGRVRVVGLRVVELTSEQPVQVGADGLVGGREPASHRGGLAWGQGGRDEQVADRGPLPDEPYDIGVFGGRVAGVQLFQREEPRVDRGEQAGVELAEEPGPLGRAGGPDGLLAGRVRRVHFPGQLAGHDRGGQLVARDRVALARGRPGARDADGGHRGRYQRERETERDERAGRRPGQGPHSTNDKGIPIGRIGKKDRETGPMCHLWHIGGKISAYLAQLGDKGGRGGITGTGTPLRSVDFRFYSHSMVAGGLLVTSRTTRLTWTTSLVTRVEIRASSSSGSRAQSAVIASSLVTGRSTIGWP